MKMHKKHRQKKKLLRSLGKVWRGKAGRGMRSKVLRLNMIYDRTAVEEEANDDDDDDDGEAHSRK